MTNPLPADAAVDQDNCPQGYYRRTNGMLHQIPTETPVDPNKPPFDLSAIDSMDAEQLRVLCRRMACQCGLVANMSEEETAQAMLDVLAETALKPVSGANMKADIQARMVAIEKWLDRKQGKPIQQNAVVIEDKRDMLDPRERALWFNFIARRNGITIDAMPIKAQPEGEHG